jgi:uncharacterized spore protein YtfJ
MKDTLETLINSSDRSQEQLLDAMKGIFAAAQPGVVYSEPVQVGDTTVITASEVVAGGGFGFGRGLGAAPERDHEADTDAANAGAGGGGGGGGGGGSSARPVAAILIGPDGVKVKPIVDVTKIALAALTAWGVMIPMMVRMSRASRR